MASYENIIRGRVFRVVFLVQTATTYAAMFYYISPDNKLKENVNYIYSFRHSHKT